jgi:hypothetical protein
MQGKIQHIVIFSFAFDYRQVEGYGFDQRPTGLMCEL